MVSLQKTLAGVFTYFVSKTENSHLLEYIEMLDSKTSPNTSITPQSSLETASTSIGPKQNISPNTSITPKHLQRISNTSVRPQTHTDEHHQILSTTYKTYSKSNRNE
eukprot:TRINITY_DN6931_c0_g1_i13.p1 TRINITY_DN6931_c0_g1~~TRINITY_DN6931_c0_g1_i13.p1  ORF type:complete len:107 (+),score=16.19 TRINITY_DN6931_c0_g1_i13:209-529(+)